MVLERGINLSQSVYGALRFCWVYYNLVFLVGSLLTLVCHLSMRSRRNAEATTGRDTEKAIASLVAWCLVSPRHSDVRHGLRRPERRGLLRLSGTMKAGRARAPSTFYSFYGMGRSTAHFFGGSTRYESLCARRDCHHVFSSAHANNQQS